MGQTNESSKDQTTFQVEKRSPTQTTPLPENVSTDGEQAVMPHTTGSTVQVAEEVVKGVKSVVHKAVAWAEEKADELSAKEEDGSGPYGSPATCSSNDLDAIAAGVLPAMPGPKSGEGKVSDNMKQDEKENSSGN